MERSESLHFAYVTVFSRCLSQRAFRFEIKYDGKMGGIGVSLVAVRPTPAEKNRIFQHPLHVEVVFIARGFEILGLRIERRGKKKREEGGKKTKNDGYVTIFIPAPGVIFSKSMAK